MKAYLVKIYPNKTQQKALDANFGCARFVYNKMIEIHQKKYKRTGKSLSGYDMQSYLPKIKKQYPFLKEADSQSLQIVCHNLADAYKRFFRKQSGYPRFKKRKNGQSFACFNGCHLKENKLKLPKIKLIKFRGGDKPEGKTKTFAVSKDSTGYYVSIFLNNPAKEVISENINNLLGIDLGLKDLIIISSGKKIKNNKFTKKHERNLRKWQKTLSRRKIGSKKRAQAKIMVGRIHKKISNQRKDFAHKISRQIVNSCDNQTAIAVEDLNVKGMVKNRKLAKSISDAGWYQFKTFLKYKAADVGKQVIEVDRFYPSSKTCSSCGVVNGDLKLSDRNWICSSCKTEHDRDLNASLNIALEAARNVAGGDVLRLERLRSGILSNVYETDNLAIEFPASIKE